MEDRSVRTEITHGCELGTEPGPCTRAGSTLTAEPSLHPSVMSSLVRFCWTLSHCSEGDTHFMLIDFVCVYVCTGDCFHGTCVVVRRQLLGARLLRLSSGFIRSGGRSLSCWAVPSHMLSDSLCVYTTHSYSAALSLCPPTSRLQQVSLLLPPSLLSLRRIDLMRVTCENGRRVGIDTTGKKKMVCL